MDQLNSLHFLSERPDTGYGSAALDRACRAAEEISWIQGSGPRAVWLRFWRGKLPQWRYRRTLPTLTIRLSKSASGVMISEHLAIRERGRRTYRHAQGILPLPPEFSAYVRGRRRQAVRTNLTRAREAGLRVRACEVESWTPGSDDSRSPHITPGSVQRWMVLNARGEVVGNSILSVDGRIALLHGLVAHQPYARWLLHTAIVERLCGNCDLLLINSHPAYRMPPGARHFQRLLGYQIAQLSVQQPWRPRPILRRPRPARHRDRTRSPRRRGNPEPATETAA